MAPKGQRIQLYVDSAALVVIDQAAEAEGRNRSEFMAAAALDRAQRGPAAELVEQLRAAQKLGEQMIIWTSIGHAPLRELVGRVTLVGADFCVVDTGTPGKSWYINLAHVVGFTI